jgi:iron complex transport system substrate-binding protein
MRAAAQKCKTIGRMARTPATAVLCLLAWTNAGRAQASPPAGREPVGRGFREVTDETGRTVRIPRDIRRIVSLAPSLTETIYALGLQDRLVGDTDFCDYPPEAREKQKIGGAINPNIEMIAKLHPDLVLAIKSLNRLETVEALQSLQIPSYTTNPKTVDEILSSIERLSAVLDAPEAGAEVSAALRRRLTKLQERLRGVPPKRVLFVVWDEPLISIGRGTFIADALRYAGAVSVVDSSQDWPQVNLEEVVRQQPDFLVFAATHSEKPAVDVQALAKRPGWRGLEAVREKRFAVISEAVNRPSPRIVGAIEDLARRLHPEAFGNEAESVIFGETGGRDERAGELCAL